jgi:hypothetical protein
MAPPRFLFVSVFLCARLVVSDRPGLVGQKQICRRLTCQDGSDDLSGELSSLQEACCPLQVSGGCFFPVSVRVEAQTANYLSGPMHAVQIGYCRRRRLNVL